MAKKNMKPATKKIVITLAVAVVLVGVMLALVLPGMLNSSQGGDESSSAVSSDQSVMILDKSLAQVDTITVKNAYGEFTVLADSQGTLLIEEISGASLDSDLMTSTFKYGYVLNASKTVGASEGEKLSSYGLDDENCATVITKFNDGTTAVTYKVGSTAGGGTGRYILYDGNIYIASVGDNLFYSMYNFVSPDVLAISVKGDGSDLLNHLKVSGTAYPNSIEVFRDEDDDDIHYDMLYSSYIMTSPIISGVTVDKTSTLLSSLASITAVGVQEYKPDSVTLQELGLADPAVRVEFTINDEAHTVIASGTVGGGAYRYVMVDDNPTVYVAQNTDISTWAEVTTLYLRDSYVWLPMMKTVSDISYTVEGKTYTFTCKRTPDDDDTKNPTYTYTALYNGTELDYNYYKAQYTLTIAPQILVEDAVQTAATGSVQVTYKYYDGGETKVEFVPTVDGQRRYAAFVDGVYSGLVKETDVKAIANGAVALSKNQNPAG